MSINFAFELLAFHFSFIFTICTVLNCANFKKGQINFFNTFQIYILNDYICEFFVMFTCFYSLKKRRFLKQSGICTPSGTSHFYIGKPIICVHHCQKDNWEKLLVIIIFRSWFVRLADPNVFPIQTSQNVVKVPPLWIPFGNGAPLHFCIWSLY